MDERSTEDPREFRGGVREPEEAKGDWADNEGVVPREMLDELPPQDTSDPQALKDAALGAVTGDPQTEDTVDESAGDEADATTRDDSSETDTWHTDPATLKGRTGQGEA